MKLKEMKGELKFPLLQAAEETLTPTKTTRSAINGDSKTATQLERAFSVIEFQFKVSAATAQ
jgi:hypothetical protein